MKKITIQKSCPRCERSSTYIKKKIGRKQNEFYVCSVCDKILCKSKDIMEHAFPFEEKPISGIGREHLRREKMRDNRF